MTFFPFTYRMNPGFDHVRVLRLNLGLDHVRDLRPNVGLEIYHHKYGYKFDKDLTKSKNFSFPTINEL